MLKPASLKEIPRYPVTAALAGAAVVVTALWWAGKNIDPLTTDVNVWSHWELWRAFTSIFPHVDPLHLIFNVYWLWVFGPVIERTFGQLRFLGIAVLFSVVSALAEFTFLYGGVGLSGLGYGLWAMLWVLQQRDPRFTGSVDSRTSVAFAAWFLFCIFLTMSDTMAVANVAHGVGAAMGALMGLAISRAGISRLASIAAMALITAFSLAGSTFWWPRLNQTEYAEAEVERLGVQALYKRENQRAVELLELSSRMKAAPARAWFNLGIAYQRVGKDEQALAAYERAARLPGADAEIITTATQMRAFMSFGR